MVNDKQNGDVRVNGLENDVSINIDNSDGGKCDSNGIKMADYSEISESCNHLAVNDKCLLGVPRTGARMSFMEEESVRERMRLTLLKQCSAILKQGDQRYNKESLHRTFQDEVRCIFLLLR